MIQTKTIAMLMIAIATVGVTGTAAIMSSVTPAHAAVGGGGAGGECHGTIHGSSGCTGPGQPDVSQVICPPTRMAAIQSDLTN